MESVYLAGANLVTEIAKICEQQWHERGERMGCPVGRVRSRLSEGSAEKREENMLSDGQRKWMRECYLCQKLWLLFSQDSPLITPPSLLFTPIFFSFIALPQLFHFLPPPSPPSQCFAPSRFFFLISFSLWVATKGWRSGSDVWMSSTNLPVKGEKKVTEQEAGESTPKWWRLVRRGVFPFPAYLLFGIWSFNPSPPVFYLPFVSLQHIQLYLQSEIERNGSSGSEVMKEDSFTNTQWDLRRRQERVRQGCVQIFLKSCVFKAFPHHFLCHVHFLIWSMWRQQFPGKEHVSSPRNLCLLCMSSLRATTQKTAGCFSM